MEFVYLALASKEVKHACKIGRTFNLAQRITQLRRIEPSLELVSFIPTTDQHSARELETKFHSLARRGARYGGDWHHYHTETLIRFLEHEDARIPAQGSLTESIERSGPGPIWMGFGKESASAVVDWVEAGWQNA